MTSARANSPRRVWIGEDDGRRVLLVDGVVQSVAVEPGREVGGYWAALLPSVRPRRALVLGLGGGTLVNLLRQRFGEVAAIGVESDEEVLRLAKAELHLAMPGLEVVHRTLSCTSADVRGGSITSVSICSEAPNSSDAFCSGRFCGG
jgi:spermidine synthase